MKTLVPGLYRGVQVWQGLCEAGEATLDQITLQTGYPKASVLRMLKTLCDLQLVDRCDVSGVYRASARIAYDCGEGIDFEKQVFQALVQLSGELGVTTEWFIPEVDGLRLVQRSAPPDAEVQVQARVGFLREWAGELDAVATLGYAFYSAAPSARSKLWAYGPQGESVALSAKEARIRIDAAQKEGLFSDVHYNTNGVRRIAASIVRDGELVGVLSFALIFTPSLELKLKGWSEALLQTVAELQK